MDDQPHSILTDELVREFSALIGASSRVVIVSHRSPDGDTIGSNMALRIALESLGKEVVSACSDSLPAVYADFPGCDSFVTSFDPAWPNLYINVDGSSVAQLVFPQQDATILDGHVPFISIDHHVSNTRFATLNIVVSEACSTTYVLFHLFSELGFHITPLMATYLYMGLTYDTGSFMHSNTTQDVLSVASRLMQLGADRAAVAKALHRSKTFGQLKLWGEVLERTSMSNDGVVLSGIMESDFASCDARHDEAAGVIDYLNGVRGSKFSVLLSEDRYKGIVKCSTRTRRSDIDLAALCRKFGGGGHKQASGFSIEGQLRMDERVHIAKEDGTIFRLYDENNLL